MSTQSPPPAPTDPADRFRLLVFSRTLGYRHDSIPAGVEALEELGARHGFAVDATEDPGAFTDTGLAGYRVVVFLSTSGEVLDESGRAAFQRYVAAGGGFVGIHAASTTGYDWPFYGELVGAYFNGHPEIQPGTVRVEDSTHPATRHLGPTWPRVDEWYGFRTNPRGRVRVLLSVDEASYRGGDMGDHPIAWCHENCGGPSFYTALGHSGETYADPEFRRHLLGGITYAAGLADLPAR
ncbi:ThuA domain-containing protein [Allostreptomyces psammosilenae]|uniref:Type 1 glutamine amidotransferase n=1 Tax=Allostreptomyces psammosilenae TaxID=1892865 RepID=A0A852ZSC4_9ACTN|nr:type 1 glutamine amidotransferase [Allostreptomyces psammosilenae]